MLKKLMIIISASLMVTSLNAVNLYNDNGGTFDLNGRVKLQSKTDTASQSQASLDNGSSRITLSGSQEIKDGVKAFGAAEWGYDPLTEGDQNFSNRLGYLGVDFKGHSFSVGRQWSSYYNVAGWTDMYETSGGEANSAYEKGSLYGTSRANSYQYNASLGIVDVSLQYQGHQGLNKDETTEQYEVERQWGAGGSLIVNANENFKLGLSAQQVKIKHNEDLPLLVAFGFNFANEALEIALTGSYQDNVIEDSAIGMESYVALKYMESGSKIYLGNNYLQASPKVGDSYEKYNYAVIGATYNILAGSKFYAFTEYKQDLRSEDDRGGNRDNLFSIGARYSF